MSYFRKVKNEAGEEIYEEVDLLKEELPEAVIKAQKYSQDLLAESITRRQEIAALKAVKKPVVSEESETPPPAKKPDVVDQTVSTPVVDPEALFSEFEKRLAAKREAELKAQEAEKTELATIIKDFGLKASAVEILAESKNPRVVAEKLAKGAYRFDEQSSGDPDKKQIDSAVGGALKKLGLQD